MGPQDGIDDRREVKDLLANLRAALPELEAVYDRCSGEWGYDDRVYRFYHQSFKVYGLQDQTREIVAALQALAPQRPLNAWFAQIVREGTGKQFEQAHNARWLEETRPIVEAFFHARFFLEMAVRYGTQLEDPPSMLPSGWAALLYLFGLRYGHPGDEGSSARALVLVSAALFGEAGQLLARLPARARGASAARGAQAEVETALRDGALYGNAKGELFALQKADVDFDARLILVSRSHDRDIPKGGLTAYLKRAIAASPSELVFPDERGQMLPKFTAMEEVLLEGDDRRRPPPAQTKRTG